MLYENTLRFFVFVVLFGSLLAANRVWSTVHLCGSQRGFSVVPWKLLAWAMGGTTTNRWFLYYMHIGYCSAVGILHTKCLLLCVNAKPNAVTILAINDCYDCNEEINVYLLLRKFGQPYFAVCSNCACLAIHPRSEHYFDEWTCKVKYSSTKRSSSQMFEQTTMKTAYDQRSYAKVKPMALLTHFCVPLKLQHNWPNQMSKHMLKIKTTKLNTTISMPVKWAKAFVRLCLSSHLVHAYVYNKRSLPAKSYCHKIHRFSVEYFQCFEYQLLFGWVSLTPAQNKIKQFSCRTIFIHRNGTAQKDNTKMGKKNKQQMFVTPEKEPAFVKCVFKFRNKSQLTPFSMHGWCCCFFFLFRIHRLTVFLCCVW